MSDKLKSMLELTELLIEKEGPITIQDIIKEISEIKEIPEGDTEQLLQLYMDITQSAKFVYCGEDKWDLKERNLALWDKDGYAFVEPKKVEEVEAEDEEVEEDLEFTEYILKPKEEKPKEEIEDEEVVVQTEEEKKEIEEEKQYIEIEVSTQTTDDDDGSDEVETEEETNYDEDNYNEIMDDYEDMYEK